METDLMRFCVEKNSERLERKSKRERERKKCLEAEKMKENENPETLKCMRGFFFFNRKGWVEFGYIVFGLNGGFLVKTQ